MLVAVLGAGCGGSSATTPKTLPNLSVLDAADGEAPATPSGCVQGFSAATVSRLGSLARFTRGSDGIGRVAYELDYQDPSGTTYSGLRVADSSTLTPVSVAWMQSGSGFAFLEDANNTPTIFFASADVSAGRTVLQARFVQGGWQVDPTPVWTGPAGEGVAGLYAGFDDGGSAHVLIYLGGDLLLASNSGGSWNVTEQSDFQPKLRGLSIQQVRIDRNGNTHLTYMSFGDGNAYATNASGQWAFTNLPGFNNRDAALAIDSANAAHIFNWNEDTVTIHDRHEGAQGMVDVDLGIASKYQTVYEAQIDANGGAHLVLLSGSFAYVTNAGGATTWTAPPDLVTWNPVNLGSNEDIQLMLDPAGQPHFGYDYNPSMNEPQYALSFVDPCN
jgi:hypothetical protein